MTRDARVALNNLLSAFERHFEVSWGQDSGTYDDAALAAAEEILRDAFFSYDDILFTQAGVELPFDILDDDCEEADEEDNDSVPFFDAEDDDDDDEDFEDFDLDDDED